jgi:hypothetical protein
MVDWFGDEVVWSGWLVAGSHFGECRVCFSRLHSKININGNFGSLLLKKYSQ